MAPFVSPEDDYPPMVLGFGGAQTKASSDTLVAAVALALLERFGSRPRTASNSTRKHRLESRMTSVLVRVSLLRASDNASRLLKDAGMAGLRMRVALQENLETRT